MSSGTIEVNPKQAELIDHFAKKTQVIVDSHDFWLQNRTKVVVESNKDEIEAAERAAHKKNWLASLTSVFGGVEEEQEKEQLRTDKIEQFITQTPFTGAYNIRGTYVWGDTGSGKTFLSDLFFYNLPIKEKQRFHYNKFMLNIHQHNFRYFNVR